MCGLALAASLALADFYGSGAGQAQMAAQMAAQAQMTQSALSREPLYAEIVARAHTLEAAAKTLRAQPAVDKAAVADIESQARALSALDMKGHFDLAARGSDGDLKCILKGISEDLPRKAGAVETAARGPEQAAALNELIYLLNDNAGVILATPRPPA